MRGRARARRARGEGAEGKQAPSAKARVRPTATAARRAEGDRAKPHARRPFAAGERVSRDRKKPTRAARRVTSPRASTVQDSRKNRASENPRLNEIRVCREGDSRGVASPFVVLLGASSPSERPSLRARAPAHRGDGSRATSPRRLGRRRSARCVFSRRHRVSPTPAGCTFCRPIDDFPRFVDSDGRSTVARGSLTPPSPTPARAVPFTFEELVAFCGILLFFWVVGRLTEKIGLPAVRARATAPPDAAHLAGPT